MTEAWFSALGEPLGEAELAEIAGYLGALALPAAVQPIASWDEAGAACRQPAQAWWHAEEAERERLEQRVRLDPADREWLRLNEALHGAAAVAAARAGCADAALVRAAAGAASYAAYQARLAQAAGMAPSHPFLRKYALYCGGRWPLGVYAARFAIF
ncbi:MAG TPA: hypothetical protein VM489_00480 [Burkholderiales bacterium]|nr:hypothetical protein [Burkholderiales bacterium]